MEQKASKRCPIDFDQHSPEHAAAWPETFQRMRSECPRAWSENHGGFWIASRYQDILKIAQQPEAFSTAKTFDPVTGAPRGGVSLPSLSQFRGIPNEIDGPEWKAIRELLNPLFGPRAAEKRRPTAKKYAAALLDRVIESGEIDFVPALTSPLPGIVTMEILGLPLADWKRYASTIHQLVFLDKSDPKYDAAAGSFDLFRERVDQEVEIRRTHPQDDLFTHLAQAEIDGAPLDTRQVQDICFNILAGGVDTTTALTSNALVYLGRNPADRARLAADRALIPHAREEFLRYFSPLHGLARTVAQDVAVDGWEMEKGDRILLAYSSANRDGEIFEDPETVKIDRTGNRHIAFGAGIHRCLGSFVARIMFEEMVNAVLDRMPDYELQQDGLRPYPHVGGVNGWINVRARFAPGTPENPIPDWLEESLQF